MTNELFAKATSLGERAWKTDNVGHGRIVADRQRLTQAMVQLAENATQHTSAGDEIGIGSEIDDGVARFWVRDKGPGIPASEQQRVFDRFRRGSNARQRSDGAGLGLSIVKAIAEAHHGRIELDSGNGKGATFTLVMPVDQPPVEEGASR
jgi:signal transduction histidine kinase